VHFEQIGIQDGLSIGNSLEASHAPIKETEALRKYRECERRDRLVVFEIK